MNGTIDQSESSMPESCVIKLTLKWSSKPHFLLLSWLNIVRNLFRSPESTDIWIIGASNCGSESLIVNVADWQIVSLWVRQWSHHDWTYTNICPQSKRTWCHSEQRKAFLVSNTLLNNCLITLGHAHFTHKDVTIRRPVKTDTLCNKRAYNRQHFARRVRSWWVFIFIQINLLLR